MVAIAKLSRRLAIFQSRTRLLVAASVMLFFVAMLRTLHKVKDESETSSSGSYAMLRSSTIPNDNVQQCRYFLAESAIPFGGLGLFTTIDIPRGTQAQPMPDICIYVADTPRKTAFDTHSWARDVFNGSFEGKNPRAACEGFATLFNSEPNGVLTSKLLPFRVNTNAGLTRDKHPGAGAITHYYGVTSEAARDVKAGSELTIDYGDWEYDKRKKYVAPTRSVDWIRTHGMCIDNIEIKQANDPEMGRGAFARRAMKRGTMVAPAPIQYFKNRADFAQQNPEALFINYCIQPEGTDILLFPYGPGVNMINHSSKKPNVEYRWSPNRMSHNQWLDLPLSDVEALAYPGSIILEVVAIREIKEGEELFMDYGAAWENAWKEHVKNWKPVEGAADHVYPQDMDLSKPLKTIKEQELEPNPRNLMTVCHTPHWDNDRQSRMEWKEPAWEFPEGLVPCAIIGREQDPATGSYLYEVALTWDEWNPPPGWSDLTYVDTKVPQKAIVWVERPYSSDLHLPNAFRHPIALPDKIYPEAWKPKGR